MIEFGANSVALAPALALSGLFASTSALPLANWPGAKPSKGMRAAPVDSFVPLSLLWSVSKLKPSLPCVPK